MEVVFVIIKSKLKEAGLNDLDAFFFFKSTKRFEDYVTLKGFRSGTSAARAYRKISRGSYN